MRLSLNQTEEHPSTIALESFNERLAEATEDRWSIDVYPNETLGAQQEALQMVSNGSVDMAIVSGTQLENLNKVGTRVAGIRLEPPGGHHHRPVRRGLRPRGLDVAADGARPGLTRPTARGGVAAAAPPLRVGTLQT